MGLDSNPTDVREQERLLEDQERSEKLRRDQEIEDLKWVLAHRQGRRFVAWLLGETGWMRSTFAPDARQHAFLDGMRNIGLVVIGKITDHCPERLYELLREYGDASRTRSTRN